MHGAGNDFVLFDNRTLEISDEQIKEWAPRLSDRKYGIGSDGIIALHYDHKKQADLVMIYKNPDGSDAGMCGNGARCFAMYAVSLGAPASFSFRVHDNVYQADVDTEHNRVIIHFPLETTIGKRKINNEEFLDVYTNTEHLVCSVSPDQLSDEAELTRKGREIRHHEEVQPKGTNVNFISGTGPEKLSLQTYERGVEELTLACGTGAIASALAWHHLQDAPDGDFIYTVHVKGGTLTIHFTFTRETSCYYSIKLEGPISFVFEGRYHL